MLNESAKPNDILRLEKATFNIKFRSSFMAYIRDFFLKNSFIEVNTPVMIEAPAPEDYINAPRTGASFLRSSPELHMKRLIASGLDKIFQIGPCFRENEVGKLHNTEFTMLEWYEVGKNYNDLIPFTKFMITSLSQQLLGKLSITYQGIKIDLEKEWMIITVHDAFNQFTHYTPEKAIKENIFEILLTEKIEPQLPKNIPVILKDYPASMAALSRLKRKNPSLAERWELYLGGIEIANTYSELTDYQEQKIRFKQGHKNRQINKLPEYSEDKNFFEALKYGIPDFSGTALGIDRLIMIFTDSKTIDEVISFKA